MRPMEASTVAHQLFNSVKSMKKNLHVAGLCLYTHDGLAVLSGCMQDTSRRQPARGHSCKGHKLFHKDKRKDERHEIMPHPVASGRCDLRREFGRLRGRRLYNLPRINPHLAAQAPYCTPLASTRSKQVLHVTA